jgi:hypothetical protein
MLDTRCAMLVESGKRKSWEGFLTPSFFGFVDSEEFINAGDAEV